MEQPQPVEGKQPPTNYEGNNGTNHLDEIARSLKVPDTEVQTVQPQTTGGTEMAVKPKRQPAAGEKDETAAVNLLLGMSNDTEDEKPNQEVAPAAAAAAVRRSERRRPSGSGLNPPATAPATDAVAVENEDDAITKIQAPKSKQTGVGRGEKSNSGKGEEQKGSAEAQAQAQAQAEDDPKPPVAPPTGTSPLDPLQQMLSLDPTAGMMAGTAPMMGTTARMGSGSGSGPGPSPAQKSELTLLCERFMHQFGHLQPDGSPTQLMLNDVAEALGVARRRLYDVINVFESINVMQRVGKLTYEFCGYDHLPALLEKLNNEEEAGVPVEDRIRRAPAVNAANTAAPTTDEPQPEVQTEAPPQPPQPQPQMPSGGGQGNRSTSHSLWVLSRRLVRMLLKSHGPIALTAAAAVLVGPAGVTDPSEHRSQTQITVERRLYDIGSILCSLGLVDRVYIKKRQPAFEWVYGWRPGAPHPPPELAVAVMSRQPAPPLPLMPKRAEEPPSGGGASRSGGKRGSGRSGGGGGAKRQRGEQAAASAGMLPLAGLSPYGLPPMPPIGVPFPQSVLAAMSGLTPPPGTGASGTAGMEAGDKGASLAMAQLFSNPALFNPMAMGMSLPGIMPGADLNLTAPFGFGPGSEGSALPPFPVANLNGPKEGEVKAGGEGEGTGTEGTGAGAGAGTGEGEGDGKETGEGATAGAITATHPLGTVPGPGGENVPGETAGLSTDMATMQQLAAAMMWPPMFMHPAMLQMQQMAAAANGASGNGEQGGEGGTLPAGTLPAGTLPTEGMDAAFPGGGFGMQFLNPLLQGVVPMPGSNLPTGPGGTTADPGVADAATNAATDTTTQGDAQQEPSPLETGVNPQPEEQG